MLSYRHSFHAGNFADVIKHIVQVEILEHLLKKDKPFEYIDTHSGAGLFSIKSDDMQKLQEYNNGIAKLDSNNFPEISSYFEAIQAYNGSKRLEFYPGSPAIAKHFLRTHDRAWLYELHPQDFKHLTSNIGQNRKVKIAQEDGLKGMNSIVPTKSRRALILIDPSYEVKAEYELVIESVIKAYGKFSTGVYAIWYPVVERNTINMMERKLKNSGIKNIQQFELGIASDSSGRGMTSSGMFVINPPWTIKSKMSSLLPKLAQTLAGNAELFKCITLVEE
ncbi:23S rRNA (adenine(2030)-N(6))-methyltransferase RlmJ [Parashewanella spongiae]|uniref:Ribosomal RNA large subunit methyltransferase J n=1 Tax=Parashewanella spongiae TaxID=342950 RepID=A0A3A6TZ09_9GAMM|nr:23S rRNA (adenine(2030)-N(6))-methyltransferase RlmJ [Parashewanella spongiae]MCL1079872.1 23S rRNA (adenine(2030)-N(6))-methyltransferase RlmJ [Parashewanella spongiae]RJY06654.1 23S rRNA (adenine(2030)-N(6))-methyltransferase RlmJ [Parashewanella spongiae]